MSKLNVAVIGVGNMGKNHVRAYSEISKVRLVAISDLNEMLGNTLSNEFNVKYYKNYKKMLDVKNPDIVSVCVPTSLHYGIAKECVKMGVNVLLEKPIAMDISDAEKLLKLVEENNIKFLVGHIERYNPVVKKTKEIIERGDLGKITAIIARRVGGFPPQIKDANIAVDLAIHDIDIINYLLDDLPVESLVNKQKNHIKKREDSVEFFLKYKQSSAYIQANWITPVKIRKLNITGSEGYLEMDYINQQIEFYKSNYDKFKETSMDFSDYILRFSAPDKINISVAKKEPLKEEILYFINCVENNIKIDSRFALEALRIALT
ncbi:Gfo/Idh/MocA family oxidoreductase [Candidatus Parcubacteria bacterium]|nr:Gfo/Idh/MocA family oxidoreductase [Candidatus Parcubacteria bacterium]